MRYKEKVSRNRSLYWEISLISLTLTRKEQLRIQHTEVGNKHSSEIGEDAQAEQRKNPELSKLETFPKKLTCLHCTDINQNWKPGCAVLKNNSEPKFWNSILKRTNEITGHSTQGGNLIPSEPAGHICS